jgi:hypothetical protein
MHTQRDTFIAPEALQPSGLVVEGKVSTEVVEYLLFPRGHPIPGIDVTMRVDTGRARTRVWRGILDMLHMPRSAAPRVLISMEMRDDLGENAWYGHAMEVDVDESETRVGPSVVAGRDFLSAFVLTYDGVTGRCRLEIPDYSRDARGRGLRAVP